MAGSITGSISRSEKDEYQKQNNLRNYTCTAVLRSAGGTDNNLAAQIIEEAQKFADAQIAANRDKVAIDWTWAVMDTGYSEFSHVAPNGADYTRYLTAMADEKKWTPLLRKKDEFNVDDLCITQTFLDLCADHPDPAHLAAFQPRLDALVDHLTATATAPKLTFWWCDSLFMGPPALARMSAITKNPKYLDAMDHEYWRTVDLLYDHQEHLFSRDATFLHKTNVNGRKIFWSRGNGWVLAGLARLLPYMPADYPSRSKFELLFKEMAAKIVSLQSSDGTWHASINDPSVFPGSETSGTALFTSRSPGE